jgi:hypothetical protein
MSKKPKSYRVGYTCSRDGTLCIVNGMIVAKRPKQRRYRPRTWISLKAGWTVRDTDYKGGFEVRYKGALIIRDRLGADALEVH